MNSYELSRDWFDYSFANPEKIKPNHTALFFFCIEHCNRLGWKKKFGLPTTMVMEAIGIKSYNTYIKTLNDVVSFGFVKMVEKSKNQYSANIIELSKFNKAPDKALDKALIKHGTKQRESTEQSNCSIDKQYNKEQINQLTKNHIKVKEFLSSLNVDIFNFRKSLLELGIEENIIIDWLKVRKTKKASNTETAFNKIKKQIEISEMLPTDCIRIAVENSWSGFQFDWIKKDDIKKKASEKRFEKGVFSLKYKGDLKTYHHTQNEIDAHCQTWQTQVSQILREAAK